MRAQDESSTLPHEHEAFNWLFGGVDINGASSSSGDQRWSARAPVVAFTFEDEWCP